MTLHIALREILSSGMILSVNVFTTVGSGLAGVEEIKAHPFFASIDWSTV